MIFEPDDFIARLAALVPKPRAHLTRYHGVFAPASPDRAGIVPRTGAVTSTERAEVIDGAAESVSDRQRAMSWAQRLRRVFAIDIDKSAGLPICTTEGRREAVWHRDVPDETCRQCGGRLRVIASIEAPAVIERILEHLGRDAGSVDPAHPSRASPERDTSF